MFVVLIRTVILLLAVSMSIKIMGKRTIGELQSSELVIVLLLSDIAAVPMQATEIPLLSGIVPIAVLTASEVIFSILIMKYPRFGRVICGRPVVIIASGKIEQKAMRELRITCEDLFESLRKNGVFDISAVEYAVMETDGTISVLKKSSQEPPTAQTLGIDAGKAVIRALIISDGSLDEHSMNIIGWDEKKLRDVIKRSGGEIKNIFMLTGCSDGSYECVKKERIR